MTKGILRTISIVICFLLSLFSLKLGKLGVNLPSGHYLPVILSYLFIAIIIIVSISFLYHLNITGVISELGLKQGLSRGLVFGFAATLPMTVSSAILFKVSDHVFAFSTLVFVLIGPIMEEILFRGYLFGQLFRREGWGFIPASLIASVFFGMGHLYQSNDLSAAAGTFLVTFVGSAWFAWLYIEHNSNLWVPMWLHVFMNLSWTIFQTNTPGAVGSNTTNLFRIVTIIITIVYTIRYSKKHGRKINKNNLWIHGGSTWVTG